MSHTPGPWEAEGSEWGNVHQVSDEANGVAYDISNIDDQYLIAAAPELLVACKLALPLIVNYVQGNQEAADVLEAVIAKAEGR